MQPEATAPATTSAVPPMAAGGTTQTMPNPAPQMGMGGATTQTMMPYANGGAVPPPAKKNPLKDFFADINMVEAGILALGVAAFIYAIYYYKFEMNLAKTSVADLDARVKNLEIENQKRKAAEKNANAAGNLRARRRMVI